MLERRWILRSGLSVVEDGPERTYLLGPGERHLLRGRAYPALFRGLSPERTLDVILDASGLPLPEIYFVADRAIASGWLVQVSAPAAPRFALHVEESLDAAAFEVALRNPGPGLDGTHIHLVRDLGNCEIPSMPGPQIVVALPGPQLWITPRLLGSDASPCPICLRDRVRSNRPVERHIERKLGFDPSRRRWPLLPGALELAATQLAALSRSSALDPDQPLRVWEPERGRVTEHPLARRPQCSGCGDPGLVRAQSERPMFLEPRPLAPELEDAARMSPLDALLPRLERQLSPVTGLVASAGPLEGRDHPLRSVYGAAYFVTPADAEPGPDDFDRRAAGRGPNPGSARASALAEALERRSAVFAGGELRIRARLEELDGPALTPPELLLFSDAQLQARAQLNAGVTDVRKRIPEPFEPTRPLDWTRAWSLDGAEARWVPFGLCYGYIPGTPDGAFVSQDPNGVAAGSCLEEALLHALLEVVERDAVALWWYAQGRVPGIALAETEDPWVRRLLAHYAELGWRVWALDLRTDFGIPVVVALARSEHDGRDAIGFGAHLEGRVALRRALTEVNQLLDLDGSRPAPFDRAALPDPSFLEPRGAIAPSSLPSLGTSDLRTDVLVCRDRIRDAGWEVWATDLSRPDYPLRTVKVWVPGARHFWPRLGPGRLYEVPPRLGWVEKRPREADLNPVPLFL